jgi:hypothetical protein
MQKQLLEMTDIPDIVKSKIAMVTKALEQFMTMDADALEESWKRASIEREESQEMSSEKQFSSIPEENEEEAECEEDIESEGNNNDENSESFEHFEMEHSTRETSFSFEDLEEQYKKLQDNEETSDTEKSDDDDDDEKSICESEMSEEALKHEEEKKKKNEKIQKLQNSWQKLCLNTKTIHK